MHATPTSVFDDLSSPGAGSIAHRSYSDGWRMAALKLPAVRGELLLAREFTGDAWRLAAFAFRHGYADGYSAGQGGR